MPDIVLVEESLTESALACIAIALRRPGTQVAEARDLAEAKQMLRAHVGHAPLVILGWRALRNGLDPFFQAVGSEVIVIGLADDLGESARERALRAGVRAIYKKPLEWGEFANTVETILGDWVGAAPGGKTTA